MAQKDNLQKGASFFKRMFMDDNDINEKSIVGFGAFVAMVVCLGVDLWTGYKGQAMPINEFIYDGFLWICLGAFGIASVDKYLTGKNRNEGGGGSEEPM